MTLVLQKTKYSQGEGRCARDSLSVLKASSGRGAFLPACLAQCFVEGDGYRVGQIMAAGVFTRHGNSVKLFGITLVEGLGQAMSLIAENQPVALRKALLVDVPLGLGAAEKEAGGVVVAPEKIIPVFIKMPVQVGPVVQARAAQVGLVQQKSQRLDQVQRCVRADTKPTDGAGVLRDLWSDQDDVVAGLHGKR